MHTVEEAIAALRGDDWDLRNAAERFLAQHADADLLFPLAADRDWKVRLIAVRALAQIPGPSAAVHSGLLQRLEVEDDEWVVRNLRWGLDLHSCGDDAG